jgi:hypothetical protein
MNTLTILNGAYKAELVKGKWEYTPTFKIPKKVIDKGSEKEKPQYSFIMKAEKEVVDSYRKTLNRTVLDIAQFLKTINSARHN